MTIDTGIDKSSLSLKAIARRAKEEAKRAIANARLQVLSLEADMIQSARTALDSALEVGKSQIIAKFKEETGFTPQEARYKALEAYRKAKEAVSDGKAKINQLRAKKEARKKKEQGDDYEAPLDTDMKVKPEEKLDEIIKKMPPSLYNAFFLNEILEVVDKAKTVVAQAKELGPKAVEELNGHIKFIQDNFKKGPELKLKDKDKAKPEVGVSDDVYSADSSVPSYMASDGIEIDSDALNKSLMEELAKSKASTIGDDYDYSDKKPTVPVADIALGMLTTVLPILVVIQHLAENWQTNKYGLLADSDERLNNVFMQNAKGEEVPASDVIDPLLDSIPGLRDTEEDDGSEDDEEPREDYLKDYAHVDYLPSNPTAFVSKTIPVYSELDRVYASLSLATKSCKYNEEFELISLSTPTDGGKVENLRHAGNNKIELVDAIEAINEGERLLEAYEDPAYREWLDNLTPYKGGTSVGGSTGGEDSGDYSYSGGGGSSESGGGDNETGEENTDLLEKYPELEGFLSIVKITDKDTETLAWLHALYGEAHSQFYDNKSDNGMPYLYSSSNFPTIIDYYGSSTDSDKAFEAMRGWVLALALSELVPSKRDSLLKKGYNIGGDKDTPIYKYAFHSDPNIARLVASAVYVTMRTKFSSKISSMRTELGGSKFSGNTAKYSEESYKSNSSSFYISLNFLPSAPGPYVDGYTSRSSGEPYPGWSGKTSDKNLTKDKETYDYVVANYNVGGSSYSSRTIQAIADKEGDPAHLFGSSRTVGTYSFNPVFGSSSIGKTISSSGSIASLAGDMFSIGSTARHSLLSPNYGRMRPGGTKTDAVGQSGAGGILCDFDIENNDGCPTEYDRNGNLVVGKETNPGEFCEYSRKHLYANSYPSGHSAGIWNTALMLMEIMPDKADRIMRAANEYAMSRVIARYHWNSDTIVGRVLGSAINAVTHATSDYDSRLSSAKSEL